jgi:hypothetical protein
MKSRKRLLVTKTTGQVSKVCGNCRYHNTYRYPDLVFCFSKFANKQKPVVSILFSCDEWESKLQECFCLEDYQKKQKKTTK